MKIYVLHGKKNCGKSSTIKEIYRILSIKYQNCISFVKSKPYEDDITIVIEIKIKNKNFLIGIESYGDDQRRIKRSLNTFTKKKCDIVFCAARTGLESQVAKWAKESQQNVPLLSVISLQNKFQNKNTEAEINCSVAKHIIIEEAGLKIFRKKYI
jgi:hypothetical protein